MAEQSRRPIMGARLVIALVLICAISFIAVLALTAYAPELRTETNGGANALSKSAIGFAGLHALLEDAGIPAAIDRGQLKKGPQRLSILTPDENSSPSTLRTLAYSGPCLIVLPKWQTMANPLHMGWVNKVDVFTPDLTQKLLKEISKSTTVSQGAEGTTTHVHANARRFDNLWTKPLSIDRLQTIAGKDWTVDIADAEGHAVLAHWRDTEIYILSDPDFVNTQALHDRTTARGAFVLIARLRAGAPVDFDVTLNGYGSPRSLLRAAFAPPFLGATLCAILAAMLMGYHAVSRFGTPLRPDAVYAFGKTMLVNNSAALIRMLGRDHAMTTRYAVATRGLVVKSASGANDLSADALVAVERRAKSAKNYVDLLTEAGNVRGSAGALKVANEIYQWRVGITHDDR
jgi:hypothetical protein